MSKITDILFQGGVIIYPTETFFGIGCKISAEKSIERIFKIKQRPLNSPLPLILGNIQQIDSVAVINNSIKKDFEKLIKEFWPGSLTLLLPAKTTLSNLLTGNTGKIAVRISPHPAPTFLSESVKEPIVSTSANLSGQPAVTSTEELNESLLKHADAVFDMPPQPMGGEASTIVEPLGFNRLKLIRKGAITQNELLKSDFMLVL